jgi:AcrR family transcriptional regulator
MFFKRTFLVLSIDMPTKTKNKSGGWRADLPKQPLPRGFYAISPRAVAADQRRRLLEALPLVIAERSLETVTVAAIAKRAGVSPGTFYEQFDDKRECFAVAYEQAQEKLLGVLTLQCYMGGSLEERVERALEAGLDALAAEPHLAKLIAVEAPAAGGEIATRHHEWLDRYGRMLRLAALGEERRGAPRAAIESAIAGGIASRIAGCVLRGERDGLAVLAPQLSSYVLSFFGPPVAESEPVRESAPPQPQSPLRVPVAVPTPA